MTFRIVIMTLSEVLPVSGLKTKTKRKKAMYRIEKFLIMLIISAFCIVGCGTSDTNSSKHATKLTGGSVQGNTLSTEGDVASVSSAFSAPYGITTDGTYFYVSDYYNGLVVKLDTTSDEIETETLAGTYTTGLISGPSGITTDGNNLYVIDTSSRSIIKINLSTGDVSTLIDHSVSKGSAFYGITTDDRNLYISVTDRHTIVRISMDGSESEIIAGIDNTYGYVDGSASEAMFNSPHGITTDGENLYVADTDNHLIRKIVIDTGEVTTLAGVAGTIGNTDGSGAEATFYLPMGITSDGTSLFISDSGNQLIRRINLDSSEVTTPSYVIKDEDTEESVSEIYSGSFGLGLTTDGKNLYMADTGDGLILKIQ